jgi:hypothetical protein
VTVTVNPLPAAPVISQNGNVLTSTSGSTYQWYFNSSLMPGETNQTCTILQSGVYSVCITDVNGCSNCSQGYNAIFTGSWIENEVVGLTVFPNPGNGIVTISFTGMVTADDELRITDAIGRIIYSESLPHFSGAYSRQFDLQDEGAGIYFFTLRSNDGSIVRKIIVY